MDPSRSASRLPSATDFISIGLGKATVEWRFLDLLIMSPRSLLIGINVWGGKSFRYFPSRTTLSGKAQWFLFLMLWTVSPCVIILTSVTLNGVTPFGVIEILGTE